MFYIFSSLFSNFKILRKSRQQQQQKRFFFFFLLLAPLLLDFFPWKILHIIWGQAHSCWLFFSLPIRVLSLNKYPEPQRKMYVPRWDRQFQRKPGHFGYRKYSNLARGGAEKYLENDPAIDFGHTSLCSRKKVWRRRGRTGYSLAKLTLVWPRFITDKSILQGESDELKERGVQFVPLIAKTALFFLSHKGTWWKQEKKRVF